MTTVIVAGRTRFGKEPRPAWPPGLNVEAAFPLSRFRPFQYDPAIMFGQSAKGIAVGVLRIRMVAVRTLVMLAFLIVLPLAAVAPALVGRTDKTGDNRKPAAAPHPAKTNQPNPPSGSAARAADTSPPTAPAAGREQAAEDRGESPLAVTSARVVSPDRLAEIQRELQRLGAEYYRLESWADERPVYRFFCRIEADSSGGGHRVFEATREDSLAAMEQVLADVQAWRGRPHRNARHADRDEYRR